MCISLRTFIDIVDVYYARKYLASLTRSIFPLFVIHVNIYKYFLLITVEGIPLDFSPVSTHENNLFANLYFSNHRHVHCFQTFCFQSFWTFSMFLYKHEKQIMT